MTEIDTKDPKFLAFWTKCIRESSHWSQEALAAASGLDVRTIQRIEAGHPVSVTTRRALARGLGYDNPDVFEDPEFIMGVHALLEGMRKVQDEEVQKQFPDHMRVSVARVTSGEGLLRVAYEANAYLFHADEAIADEAKEIAASIFDFLRDLGELGDDGSFAERLGYQRSLGELLEQLEASGATCYNAFRATKMVGENWADKTPIPLTVGYVTVVPVEKVLTEMMVPRRLS
ncbi:MAG: helix-turn-helix transcriptional regulator [Nitratireductor rhodophyticola]|uniref:helix-turn-helix domain-containing protein n=1 Tax=Nitratireductor rhodophyticola TaxID=2854036 RepID=UPI0032D955FE